MADLFSSKSSIAVSDVVVLFSNYFVDVLRLFEKCSIVAIVMSSSIGFGSRSETMAGRHTQRSWQAAATTRCPIRAPPTSQC
jgi:hypothetical protein